MRPGVVAAAVQSFRYDLSTPKMDTSRRQYASLQAGRGIAAILWLMHVNQSARLARHNVRLGCHSR